MKPGAIEQGAIALSVHSTVRGYMGKDPLRLACRGLFSIGVTSIGDHIQYRLSYRRFRSFGLPVLDVGAVFPARWLRRCDQ